MNLSNIAHARMHNQQISATRYQDPAALVAYMGALQAQDYPMAKWALGLRVRNATNALVEQALDKGEIVRTHVLRPTWHLVAGEDIRWMLALTAQQIKASSAARRRELGLDEQVLGKSTELVQRALEGGIQMTREELMQVLERNGIATDPHRAVHFMFEAELKGIVCNGAMRGAKLTYALMDEKIPPSRHQFDREAALHQLAQRYFNSHGPATLADFYWWSGLPMGDARKALEMVKPGLSSLKIGEQVYWFHPDTNFKPQESLLFLPAFDEFTVSYKDRSAVMAPHYHGSVVTVNGIFKPIIVENGQVVGIWKRSIKKAAVQIEPEYFDPITSHEKPALNQAIQKFGNFLGLEAQLTGA